MIYVCVFAKSDTSRQITTFSFFFLSTLLTTEAGWLWNFLFYAATAAAVPAKFFTLKN